MQKLLDTIWLEAHVGHAVEFENHLALGLEQAMWQLFPVTSIISADYEEEYVSSL
jgi:hypothetical protein